MNRKSIQHNLLSCELKNRYPNIKIIEEYNVGNNLFIDIFLPAFKIGIEIDGEQHFSYNSFFHKNGMIDFNLQKLRDKKKDNICFEKDIFLYRVRFDDKRDFNEIIDDIFHKYAKAIN